MQLEPRCTRTVVFSCSFLGERNEELLVLMLAVLIEVTSPERFKVNYICPHQYRLCFYTDVLHGVEIVP